MQLSKLRENNFSKTKWMIKRGKRYFWFLFKTMPWTCVQFWEISGTYQNMAAKGFVCNSWKQSAKDKVLKRIDHE